MTHEEKKIELLNQVISFEHYSNKTNASVKNIKIFDVTLIKKDHANYVDLLLVAQF